MKYNLKTGEVCECRMYRGEDGKVYFEPCMKHMMREC